MRQTPERKCVFPDCSKVFAPENPNSRAMYCADHRGGRLRHTAGDGTPPVALSEEQLEGLKKFLDTRGHLPPVPDKVLATRIEEMGFDTPQEAVALFGDLHYLSKIDRRATNGLAEYNPDIARERLIRWRDGLLRFTQMNQLIVQIDTLHIFALGDELEGHGKMFGSQGIQMSESLLWQVMGFVEDMTAIILSFLSRYKKIIILKVPGNHGRIAERARAAYTPDNAELFAWEIIGERLRGQCGGEWTETENGVHSLVGGLIDLHIHRSFFAVTRLLVDKEKGHPGWLCVGRHGQGIKGLDSTYCLGVETPILTRDLRWLPAGDLRVGDEIIGFEEQRTGRCRSLTTAKITHARIVTAPVYEVELEGGETLYATGEHRWLAIAKKGGSPADWISTEEMAAELNGSRRHVSPRRTYYLSRYFPVTPFSSTCASGFLAGAFDADGCLKMTSAGRVSICFAQQNNELLAAVKRNLDTYGFSYREQVRTPPAGGQPVHYLELRGGLREVVRFLTKVRPPRLLARWAQLDLSKHTLQVDDRVRVVSVRTGQERLVAEITSSSGTYISAGYGSHNTGAYDTKLRMNALLGEIIHYYFQGHNHEPQSAEKEIVGEVVQNGCFVGPSLFSIERARAAASLPSQEFLLLHPKYGKTHHHRIHLATADEVRRIEIIGAGGA